MKESKRNRAPETDLTDLFHICISVHHQCIILINQLDATLCSLIYSLLTDLNHTTQTLKCTYDCNYSVIVLLMMDTKGARNM
jgi:hypothetical protein